MVKLQDAKKQHFRVGGLAAVLICVALKCNINKYI